MPPEFSENVQFLTKISRFSLLSANITPPSKREIESQLSIFWLILLNTLFSRVKLRTYDKFITPPYI